MLAHRDRTRNQAGVGVNTAVKTVLTAAALGATAYSSLLGAKPDRRGAHPGQHRPNQRIRGWVKKTS